MVDALMSVPAKRHIVVAGEMLELGPDAADLHAACGRRMAERGVSVVVGVRGDANALVDGMREGGGMAEFVASAEAAGSWMRENLREGDVVLLKGSRGVRLERALIA
jgi:UDP-N-acetylmuramoyl-tripeptide--D-alanyl-D-alanine ligase